MKSFIVLRKELKKLNRSIVFFLGIILISLVPVIINSFVLKDNLQNSKLASIRYFDTSFLLGMYLIPLIIFIIYYYDKESDILKIIYTNPISSFQYSIGKLLTSICFYLEFILIGSIITIIFPVFYGKDIYSIYIFFISFLLFSLPLIIFFTALSNLINIILKQSIISIIVPLLLFFLLDKIPIFSGSSRLNYSTEFIYGTANFNLKLISIAAIYIGIGILCSIIGIIVYCRKDNY